MQTFSSGKAIIITYSDCVYVALSIRYATRMRRGNVWPGRLRCILSHYLIKGRIFENKITENFMF